MKIQHDGDRLNVSGIDELTAVNSNAFRDEIRAVLPAPLKAIEIDLSDTQFVDSCGLGALFALYKAASQGNGTPNGNGHEVSLRLINPRPQVRQLFELTRMHQLFEIVQR